MNLGGGGGWENDTIVDPFASATNTKPQGGPMNLKAQKKSNIVGDPFADILGGS